MKLKTHDLSISLKKYSNKWLALKPESNKVVASGNELKKVIQEARDRGIKHPIVTRIPKNYGTYILFTHEF